MTIPWGIRVTGRKYDWGARPDVFDCSPLVDAVLKALRKK